jgi:DNA polymerase-3 subunit epsilon
VIHNASFDMRFLNAELEWAGLKPIPNDQAIDTLEIARRRFPGSPASLDALCRRFGIDNSMREKHGALLDSEILADVYLELIGGKQPDFVLEQGSRTSPGVDQTWRPGPRPHYRCPTRWKKQIAAHAAFVEELGPDAIWTRSPHRRLRRLPQALVGRL